MARRLLLACALLLATACSGGDPGAGSRVTLTLVASGGEGEIRALQSLVEAFEKQQPQVRVRLDAVAEPRDLVTKLSTGFAGGQPPDVFLINYRRLGAFASRVEPVTGVDMGALYPATVQAFTRGGQLLCLPQNASSLVVYLNPALFRRAGVPLPSAAWTWDDLLQTARALSANGVEAIGFDAELARLVPFVWSAGGDVVDDPLDPSVVELGGQPARRAISYLLQLQDLGLDSVQRAARSSEDTFAAGAVAMHLDSRRAVPGLRKTSGLDFDVRPLPRGSAGRVSVLHSDGYCVSETSTDKPAARAFARFAISAGGAEVLVRSGRTVPSLRSLAQSPVFLDPAAEPRSSRAWLAQLPALRALPSSPNWYDAEGAADDVLEQLFGARLGLEDAIRQVRSRSRAELAAR